MTIDTKETGTLTLTNLQKAFDLLRKYGIADENTITAHDLELCNNALSAEGIQAMADAVTPLVPCPKDSTADFLLPIKDTL